MNDEACAAKTCVLKVAGKPFHCDECGANVFTHTGARVNELLYRCNGCGAEYAGVKSDGAARP